MLEHSAWRVDVGHDTPIYTKGNQRYQADDRECQERDYQPLVGPFLGITFDGGDFKCQVRPDHRLAGYNTTSFDSFLGPLANSMEVSNGRRSSVAPYTHVPHSIDGHSAHSAVTPRRPLVIPPIGSQANHSQQHSVNTQESDASPHHENNVPDMNNARRKSVARPSLPGIKPAALLGNYHALKVLGVGSYGKVKLAIHMPTRLKVLVELFRSQSKPLTRHYCLLDIRISLCIARPI